MIRKVIPKGWPGALHQTRQIVFPDYCRFAILSGNDDECEYAIVEYAWQVEPWVKSFRVIGLPVTIMDVNGTYYGIDHEGLKPITTN